MRRRTSPVDPARRRAFRGTAAAGLHAALAAIGLLPADFAQARLVGQAAFDARTLVEALGALGVGTPADSKDLSIGAADVSENGAYVDLSLRSALPRTDFLALLIERNPTPLVGVFRLLEGVEPEIAMTVKVSESSDALLVARVDGKYLMTRRQLKVTLGGCG